MGVTHMEEILRAKKIYIYIFIHGGKIHTEQVNMEERYVRTYETAHGRECHPKRNIDMQGINTAQGEYSWSGPYEEFNIPIYFSTAIY